MNTSFLISQAYIEKDLFLQPDVTIVPDEAGPILSRKGVSVGHRLNVAEALVLSFLSATGDPKLAATCCSDCLGDKSGIHWTTQVLDRYWTYLGNGPARPLDIRWLEKIGKEKPTQAALTTSYLAAPVSITWMVTLGCNRHCLYCFYDVTHHSMTQSESPPDATFPLNDALRMVREMAQIGTADLYLTGGEPLLRKDLLAIIQAASTVRVRTHLATKYPISSALANSLARAGVWSVTVSLDDAHPKQAAMLAGARGYLDEATNTICSLLKAGVRVEINAVATQINLNHLEKLVKFAVKLGVPKLSISPFMTPHQRPSATRLLPPPGSLEEILNRLQQQYSHCIELVLGGAGSDPNMGATLDGQLICEVGVRTLDILPDGQATRCHYLPNHQELYVGSLQKQTIMEIWEGVPLNAFRSPHPLSYMGTSCAGCDLFNACSARGRCYFTPLIHSGQLYAPDDFCVKERELCGQL